jgi:hypothetical protein
VSRTKQIFDDLSFTNFRPFDPTKFHSKAVTSASASLPTSHAEPRQCLLPKPPHLDRPTIPSDFDGDASRLLSFPNSRRNQELPFACPRSFRSFSNTDFSMLMVAFR